MSASQPMRSPLPAAFIALAVTAGASGAQASETTPAFDLGFLTDQQDALATLSNDNAAAVLNWLVTLKSQFVAAAETQDEVQALVSERAETLSRGLSVMSHWTTERAQAIAILAANITAQATVLASADGAAADAAKMATDAASAFQTALEAPMPQLGAQLTGFGLRMAGPMPGEAADPALQAQVQPLYDLVGKAFGQSQRLAAAVNWASVDKSLTIAKETVGPDNLADGMAALQTGFAQLKAAADRSVELIGLAKSEILRAVAETTRVAFATLPAGAAQTGGEEASLIPASAGATANRPFGRRIDYLGMAQRWVGLP